MDHEDIFEQGGLTFKLRLTNEGKDEDIRLPWFNDNVPNNFGILVRQATCEGERFSDDNPLNSGLPKELVLSRGASLDVNASFICNLKPGDYDICVKLLIYPDVRTKWYKVKVLAGKLIDTRK